MSVMDIYDIFTFEGNNDSSVGNGIHKDPPSFIFGFFFVIQRLRANFKSDLCRITLKVFTQELMTLTDYGLLIRRRRWRVGEEAFLQNFTCHPNYTFRHPAFEFAGWIASIRRILKPMRTLFIPQARFFQSKISNRPPRTSKIGTRIRTYTHEHATLTSSGHSRGSVGQDPKAIEYEEKLIAITRWQVSVHEPHFPRLRPTNGSCSPHFVLELRW